MNPVQQQQLLDALAEAIGNALYSLPEESPACDVSRVLLEGALAAYQQARMTPGKQDAQDRHWTAEEAAWLARQGANELAA